MKYRPTWHVYVGAFIMWVFLLGLVGFILFGCTTDISSSSRDIVTHCTTHTFGGEGRAAGTTQVEDCDISIDSKSKSKSGGL